MGFEIRRTTKEHFDLEKIILERSGIEDKELFLNPNHDSDIDASKMDYMVKALDIMDRHIENKSKVGIIVDPDADGFTSSALIYLCLGAYDVYAEPIFHLDKSHGFTDYIMSEIKDRDFDLIISPDGGTNDIKQQKELMDNDISLIILDHHIFEKSTIENEFEHDNLAIVSSNRPNQKVTNPHLSGVGVCLKFAELLDKRHDITYRDNAYYNLASIGQVGDSTNISDPEIRNIVFKGITKIDLPFLQYATSEDNYSEISVTPRGLSFSVIPMINAVSRIGKEKEREALFHGMIDYSDDTNEFKRRRGGEQVILNWTRAEEGYEIAKTVKGRQDSWRRKFRAELIDHVELGGGVGYRVIEKMEGLEKFRPLTGLVSGIFSNTYNRPFVVLFEEENEQGDTVYRGSGRGISSGIHNADISDFRQWCENTELVNFASGHANAFGIEISADNIDKFCERLDNEPFEKVVYNADMVLTEPSPTLVEYAEDQKYLIGGEIENLQFAYNGLEIDIENVTGQKTMTTIYEDMEFVIYNDDQEISSMLESLGRQKIKVDIIGEPSTRSWGEPEPQIIVKDLQLHDGDLENRGKEITKDNIIF